METGTCVLEFDLTPEQKERISLLWASLFPEGGLAFKVREIEDGALDVWRSFSVKVPLMGDCDDE